MNTIERLSAHVDHWNNKYAETLQRIEERMTEENTSSKFLRFLFNRPNNNFCDLLLLEDLEMYSNWENDPFVYLSFINRIHHALDDDGCINFFAVYRGETLSSLRMLIDRHTEEEHELAALVLTDQAEIINGEKQKALLEKFGRTYHYPSVRCIETLSDFMDLVTAYDEQRVATQERLLENVKKIQERIRG